MLPMRNDPKQLETIQASLATYLGSEIPEMNFLICKLVGSLWTTLNQSLLGTIIGEGDIGLSNINVMDNFEFSVSQFF